MPAVFGGNIRSAERAADVLSGVCTAAGIRSP